MSQLKNSLAKLASLPVGPIDGKKAKTNSHVHLPPNFSAFDQVEEALDAAASEGVIVVGGSNYYDFSVYGRFAEGALDRGIYPLFGTEIITMMPELRDSGARINDPGNPGKAYICGKGFSALDPMTPRAKELIARICGEDDKRIALMSQAMAAIFDDTGIQSGLDSETIAKQVAKRHQVPVATVHLQERHLAQAFQESLFKHVKESDRKDKLTKLFGVEFKGLPGDAVGIQGLIRTHLMKAGKPAFVEEWFVGFGEAVELIKELGGMVVYPVLTDGAKPICEFEATPQILIDNLQSRGIEAAEFIPIRNEPALLGEYAFALREAGILVAAGTEHNTLDRIPMEPFCKGGVPIPDDVAEVFYEGACIMVGHQNAALRGEPAFGQASNDDLKESGEAILAGLKNN